MVKYIFVVGGVISGVGKGVATASIGRLLKERGFKVTAVKIDPYINSDAGTMRPTEHGEVWVTADGGEIDQDLGNYERFLEIELSKENNLTTGKVYKELIDKERRGDFLGKTVSVIPHIPDLVKQKLKKLSEGYDICLVEIGGTIGDYENTPFLFAAKSLENELGKENVLHILVSYMPIPSHIEEMKTKPTQLSIRLLRENGIQPDLILCRGKHALDEIRKRKIETYANVGVDHVISMPDATGEGRAGTIYVVPLQLEKENVAEKILKKFNLEPLKGPCWDNWEGRVKKIISPEKNVDIGIVGKYISSGDFQLKDSYLSVAEALVHAGAENNCKVNLCWIDAKEVEKGNVDFTKYRGILVPGGFGSSGVEGKIKAIQYCREDNVPFLGLCFGLQLAVIEFARNVCGLDAGSAEFSENVEHKIIDILPEQKEISQKGGTMRLGNYEALLREGSRVENIYGDIKANERHRHRFEVNPEYHQILEEKSLSISGKSEDGRLAEFIELPEHKFFVATQAHPEFKSSLLNPAPLFREFVKSCL